MRRPTDRHAPARPRHDASPGTRHDPREGVTDADRDGTGEHPRPEPQVRARTLAAYAATATLDLSAALGEDTVVPAARVVEPGGAVLLLVSPEVAAAVRVAREDVAAVLRLTDVAPVAAPHRVRAHCWIAGRLTAPAGAALSAASARLATAPADPAALAGGRATGAVVRLEPGEILVDDLWGTAHVEPGTYSAAACDPLAAHEAELLQHLAAGHSGELETLARLAGVRGRAAAAVVPVALDAYGLRLRCAGPGGTHPADVRLDFGGPVTRPEQLGRALRALLPGPGTGRADGPRRPR